MPAGLIRISAIFTDCAGLSGQNPKLAALFPHEPCNLPGNFFVVTSGVQRIFHVGNIRDLCYSGDHQHVRIGQALGLAAVH